MKTPRSPNRILYAQRNVWQVGCQDNLKVIHLNAVVAVRKWCSDIFSGGVKWEIKWSGKIQAWFPDSQPDTLNAHNTVHAQPCCSQCSPYQVLFFLDDTSRPPADSVLRRIIIFTQWKHLGQERKEIIFHTVSSSRSPHVSPKAPSCVNCSLLNMSKYCMLNCNRLLLGTSKKITSPQLSLGHIDVIVNNLMQDDWITTRY